MTRRRNEEGSSTGNLNISTVEMSEANELQQRRLQQAARAQNAPGAVHSSVNFSHPGAALGNASSPIYNTNPGAFSGVNVAHRTAQPTMTPGEGGATGIDFSRGTVPAGNNPHPTGFSAGFGAPQQTDGPPATSAERMQAQLAAYGLAGMVLPPSGSVPSQASHGAPQQPAVGGTLASPLPASNEAVFAAFASTREASTATPKKGLLFCEIKRDKPTFGATKYYLHAKVQDRFLLSSRKRQNKQTANYLISLDKEDQDRMSDHFFGKVRGNFAGTEFVLYDSGDRADDAEEENSVRRELAAVLYEPNPGGVKGPRRMTVLLPLRGDDGEPEVWRPQTEADSLIGVYKADTETTRMSVLENKAPTWNEQLRAYQLNFRGRVTEASVKNSQLCDRKDAKRIVFQFGKRGSNEFALDFQYPLDATQAFAIALSSFDNKLLAD